MTKLNPDDFMPPEDHADWRPIETMPRDGTTARVRKVSSGGLLDYKGAFWRQAGISGYWAKNDGTPLGWLPDEWLPSSAHRPAANSSSLEPDKMSDIETALSEPAIAARRARDAAMHALLPGVICVICGATYDTMQKVCSRPHAHACPGIKAIETALAVHAAGPMGIKDEIARIDLLHSVFCHIRARLSGTSQDLGDCLVQPNAALPEGAAPITLIMDGTLASARRLAALCGIEEIPA